MVDEESCLEYIVRLLALWNTLFDSHQNSIILRVNGLESINLLIQNALKCRGCLKIQWLALVSVVNLPGVPLNF
jgi:hypothetical protein